MIKVLYHGASFNVISADRGEYLLEKNGDTYIAKEDEIQHLLKPDDVPKEIYVHVTEYFEKNDMPYEVKAIKRYSEHPEDNYLYEVIAYNLMNDGYACWTCWNESTKSLNFGHYNLTLKEAEKIVEEHYRKLEIDKED